MEDLPDVINPDKQKLSVNSMKAELLKNLIPINDKTVPPGKEGSDKKLHVYTEINEFLRSRVDDFIKAISEFSDFNPNKIAWYFEIYKEGSELFMKNPIGALDLDHFEIRCMVQELSKMSVTELCKLGPNRLTDIFSTLSAFYREQLLRLRKEKIYTKPDDLIKWIKNAEENDKVMMDTVTGKNIEPEIVDILDVIQLLRSRKI